MKRTNEVAQRVERQTQDFDRIASRVRMHVSVRQIYIDLSIDSVPSTTATIIIILKKERSRFRRYSDNKVRLQSSVLQCEMTSSFVASGTTEHLPLWDLASATPSTPAAVSTIPRNNTGFGQHFLPNTPSLTFKSIKHYYLVIYLILFIVYLCVRITKHKV